MIRILGMCFDRRVLFALAALGLAIWIAAPELVARAVPYLLLLACPLSMLLMMRGMGDHAGHAPGQTGPEAPDDRQPGLPSDLRPR